MTQPLLCARQSKAYPTVEHASGLVFGVFLFFGRAESFLKNVVKV